jgi:hypothetical protein
MLISILAKYIKYFKGDSLMKKSITILSLSTLLLLVACAETEGKNESENNNNQNNSEAVAQVNKHESNSQTAMNEDNEEEQEQEVVLDASTANVGDMYETNNGTFTMVTKADDFSPLKSGPITIEIDQLIIASGEIDKDAVRYSELESNEVDIIQLDYQLENRANEDVTFDMSRVTISTNTGKQLSTDYNLTTNLPNELMAGTFHSGSLIFLIEDESLEEVESIRIKIQGPRNSNFDTIGDDIDEELEF